MHHFILTIISDILHFSLLEILHIMWLPWRGYWRHCLSNLLSLTNNQQPYGLFFYSYCIPHWSGAFLQSYCCFCCHFYFFSPISLILYGRTCYYCYIIPGITYHSCYYFSFLRCSMIEPSLLIHPFHVFFFRSVIFCRINIPLS